jgi:hypothetical protein
LESSSTIADASQLEIYGAGKFHPSDAPKRDEAKAVVFHMNDVEEIDAS